MSSLPITQKIIYFIISYGLMATGAGTASLLFRKLLQLIPPILPDKPDLYAWFGLAPILLCLLCGYYIYRANRTTLHDFPNIKRFNLEYIVMVFFVGFAVVLGAQSLVLAISWLKLAFGF